jgi:hypothetical protein
MRVSKGQEQVRDFLGAKIETQTKEGCQPVGGSPLMVQPFYPACGNAFGRPAGFETRSYLAQLINGFVGWSFFDFFRVFFLAILFSLTRFALLGTAALICKPAAKVHIHFLAPRNLIFIVFLANPPLQSAPTGRTIR